ncbi:hypothetical protein KIN20_005374, partial [Parelaphostrongylus tenuis]
QAVLNAIEESPSLIVCTLADDLKRQRVSSPRNPENAGKWEKVVEVGGEYFAFDRLCAQSPFPF